MAVIYALLAEKPTQQIATTCGKCYLPNSTSPFYFWMNDKLNILKEVNWPTWIIWWIVCVRQVSREHISNYILLNTVRWYYLSMTSVLTCCIYVYMSSTLTPGRCGNNSKSIIFNVDPFLWRHISHNVIRIMKCQRTNPSLPYCM